MPRFMDVHWMTRLGAQQLQLRIAAVKAAHEDWHRSGEALAAAAALWGGGGNACGVFVDSETDEVGSVGRNCYARVRIAKTPCGLYAYGIEIQVGTACFGNAPSVWSQPFETRLAAKNHAIRALIEMLTPAHTRPAAGHQAQLLLSQLKKQLSQQTLFDL